MKKLTVIFLLMLFVSLLSIGGKAQPMQADSIRSLVLREWARAKAYTNDYLNTMPADKYNFRATDSVRSFAQQMLHLAQGNLFIMSMASGAETPSWAHADLEHSKTASSKDSVVYYVNKSYDYCISSVSETPLDKWGEIVKTPFGKELSRFALMMKTFEHQTHHRGQSTIYIRLVGVKPPNEELF